MSEAALGGFTGGGGALLCSLLLLLTATASRKDGILICKTFLGW